MLKINTVKTAQYLYELAQEYPYPMAKRALEAIKNGKNEDAAQILEEMMGYIESKHKHFLWHHLYHLTYKVILWKQLPEDEKEGTWLTDMDKHREEIALLLYKNPDLELVFEQKLASAIEDAVDSATTYIKNEPILIPSREDIFETEHHWEWYFEAQKAEEENTILGFELPSDIRLDDIVAEVKKVRNEEN